MTSKSKSKSKPKPNSQQSQKDAAIERLRRAKPALERLKRAKPAPTNKEVTLKFRATEAQAKVLGEAAAREQVSVSEFVRGAGLTAAGNVLASPPWLADAVRDAERLEEAADALLRRLRRRPKVAGADRLGQVVESVLALARDLADAVDGLADDARASLVTRIREACSERFGQPYDHPFFRASYEPGESADDALVRMYRAEADARPDATPETIIRTLIDG